MLGLWACVSEFCWGATTLLRASCSFAGVVFFRGRAVCSFFQVRETSSVPPSEEKVETVSVV